MDAHMMPIAGCMRKAAIGMVWCFLSTTKDNNARKIAQLLIAHYQLLIA